jgi:hypothetical protein
MDLIVLLWIWSAHQTAGGTPVVPLQLHLQATTSSGTVDDPVSSRGRYLVTKTKNSALREGSRPGDLHTKRAKPKRKPDFATARARYAELPLPGFGCAPRGTALGLRYVDYLPLEPAATSQRFHFVIKWSEAEHRPVDWTINNYPPSWAPGGSRNGAVMIKVRLGVASSEQADLHLPNAPDKFFATRFDKPAESGTARPLPGHPFSFCVTSAHSLLFASPGLRSLLSEVARSLWPERDSFTKARVPFPGLPRKFTVPPNRLARSRIPIMPNDA